MTKSVDVEVGTVRHNTENIPVRISMRERPVVRLSIQRPAVQHGPIEHVVILQDKVHVFLE